MESPDKHMEHTPIKFKSYFGGKMSNYSLKPLKVFAVLVIALIASACSGPVTYNGTSNSTQKNAKSDASAKKSGKRGNLDSSTSSVEQSQLETAEGNVNEEEKNTGRSTPDVEIKDEELYAAPQDISGLYLTADCSSIVTNADGSSDVQCQLQMPTNPSVAAMYTGIEVMSINEASMGGANPNFAGEDMAWSQNSFSLHIRRHNGKAPINRVFLTVRLTAADSSTEIRQIRLMKKDIVQGWANDDDSENESDAEEEEKARGPRN
jgi:hypothetical protein